MKKNLETTCRWCGAVTDFDTHSSTGRVRIYECGTKGSAPKEGPITYDRRCSR